MPFGYGQELFPLETFGRGIQVTADGLPKAKAGGITFEWSTVAALAKNTVLTGETFTDANTGVVQPLQAPTVLAGDRLIRFGTVVAKITSANAATGFVGGDQTANIGKYGAVKQGVALVRGETFIINQTVLERDRYSLYPPAIDGGRIFKARVLNGATAQIGTDVDGGAVQISQPDIADTLAVMPNISLVAD